MLRYYIFGAGILFLIIFLDIYLLVSLKTGILFGYLFIQIFISGYALYKLRNSDFGLIFYLEGLLRKKAEILDETREELLYILSLLLLLIPGFLSLTIGICLFLPDIRQRIVTFF